MTGAHLYENAEGTSEEPGKETDYPEAENWQVARNAPRTEGRSNGKLLTLTNTNGTDLGGGAPKSQFSSTFSTVQAAH